MTQPLASRDPSVAGRIPAWGPPVAVLLVLAAAAALAALGDQGRKQLLLSFTRRPQPFVEASFGDARAVERSCVGGESVVDLVVASHLHSASSIAYEMAVVPARGKVALTQGYLTVSPGASGSVHLPFTRPEGGWRLSVTVRPPEGAPTPAPLTVTCVR